MASKTATIMSRLDAIDPVIDLLTEARRPTDVVLMTSPLKLRQAKAIATLNQARAEVDMMPTLGQLRFENGTTKVGRQANSRFHRWVRT